MDLWPLFLFSFPPGSWMMMLRGFPFVPILWRSASAHLERVAYWVNKIPKWFSWLPGISLVLILLNISNISRNVFSSVPILFYLSVTSSIFCVFLTVSCVPIYSFQRRAYAQGWRVTYLCPYVAECPRMKRGDPRMRAMDSSTKNSKDFLDAWGTDLRGESGAWGDQRWRCAWETEM